MNQIIIFSSSRKPIPNPSLITQVVIFGFSKSQTQSKADINKKIQLHLYLEISITEDLNSPLMSIKKKKKKK